jgi:hypothetical protein
MTISIVNRFAKAAIIVLSAFGLGLPAVGQTGVVPTMGKEFWLGFMSNYQGNTPASLDIFISSPVNTTGTVYMPVARSDLAFVVAANNTPRSRADPHGHAPGQ